MNEKLPKFIKNIDFRVVVFLLIVTVILFGANPFKETLAPMDLLMARPGWRNVNIKVKSIHPERSDPLDSKIPGWISAKNLLKKGYFPYLNFENAGRPNYSFTRSLWTPAFWTFAVIPNDAMGFYFASLVNCIIGLLGMYFFLRLFFAYAPSAFGAFIFMFSGFNIAWFYWQHVNTSVWVPWVFFTVFAYLEKKDSRYLPFIALSMTMLNLGGFPMVSVMAYMALAIMLLVYFIYKKDTLLQEIPKISFIGIYSFLSVIIALPFVIPLFYTFKRIGGLGYRHGGTIFKLADFKLFYNAQFGHYMVEKTLYAGLIPLFLLGMVIILHFRKKTWQSKAFLLLFIFSITIAFALINANLIRMIPTLNKNPWNRFSFLIDTSISMLAAYALNYIWISFKNKKLALTFISILFILHFVEMNRFFRCFNEPVPNESFYPVTPSIKFMQDNIKPLQYVIGDSGYMICGVLSAYGLPEWFAHTYQAKPIRKVLKKVVYHPFLTPTAAAFKTSQIKINSPYLDYLNVKFIAVTNHTFDSKSINIFNSRKKQKVPAPNINSNNLKQIFFIDQKTIINGVSFFFATYRRLHPFSDVILTLKKDNKVLIEQILKKNEITDNAWATFKFDDNVPLLPGKYTFSLKMSENIPNDKLTIWAQHDKSKNYLLVNNQKTDLVLQATLIENRTIPDKYRIRSLENNIQVIENKNVKGGAYFLKELTMKNPPIYDNIHTEFLSGSSIKIEVSSKYNGYIVLPIRNFNDWTASVNGEEFPVQYFLDMMPAVKINGPATIVFLYKPPYFFSTIIFAGIALSLVFASIFFFFKRK
jgi:hypothetical protein